ncbi:MAG: hypothetical protein NC111_05315 [Bacteroides sp.]|nr:hypothetical protein [Bacteroides sp.]MCM1413387.1 hypothetical protein [Bacteroides sp.]MCM1471927.1 hypothetical protein [Bacteroides sp.]
MKIRKSTILPLALFVYLLVMAFIGRGMLTDGRWIEYVVIFGVTLVCIVLLHFTLKKREMKREQQWPK